MKTLILARVGSQVFFHARAQEARRLSTHIITLQTP